MIAIDVHSGEVDWQRADGDAVFLDEASNSSGVMRGDLGRMARTASRVVGKGAGLGTTSTWTGVFSGRLSGVSGWITPSR